MSNVFVGLAIGLAIASACFCLRGCFQDSHIQDCTTGCIATTAKEPTFDPAKCIVACGQAYPGIWR